MSGPGIVAVEWGTMRWRARLIMPDGHIADGIVFPCTYLRICSSRGRSKTRQATRGPRPAQRPCCTKTDYREYLLASQRRAGIQQDLGDGAAVIGHRAVQTIQLGHEPGRRRRGTRPGTRAGRAGLGWCR